MTDALDGLILGAEHLTRSTHSINWKPTPANMENAQRLESEMDPGAPISLSK